MVGGNEDLEAFGVGGMGIDAGGASFGHEPFGMVGCLGGFGLCLGYALSGQALSVSEVLLDRWFVTDSIRCRCLPLEEGFG